MLNDQHVFYIAHFLRKRDDIVGRSDPRIECRTEQTAARRRFTVSDRRTFVIRIVDALSKSTLKNRRKRLSSTTRGIIRDFGEESERPRQGGGRGRRRGAQTGMSPVRHSIIRVIDPSLLLVHSIPVRRNERGCERHPARRGFPQTRCYTSRSGRHKNS